jgi:hypothetical protein
MKRLMIVLGVLMLASAAVLAQDDTTLTDVNETSSKIRRKPNGEWMAGIQRATYTQVLTYQGETIPGSERDYGFTYFGFGYGGHIPLTEVGTYGTIWLVAAGSLWLNISDLSTTDAWGNSTSDPSIGFDVNVPIHATISYGALRRKSMAWGIEGGLGVNVGLRTRSTWDSSEFTFAPSALVDISYAPKNVYRLRLMADIISSSLSAGGTYQTWSVMFVMGI